MKNQNNNADNRIFDEASNTLNSQGHESTRDVEVLDDRLGEARLLIEKLTAELDAAHKLASLRDDQIVRLRHAQSRYLSSLEKRPILAVGSNTDEIRRLELVVYSMLNSTSWRVTKPLRWLKTSLRRG